MGMLWALSTVKDLIIVEFGPEGTTRSLLESIKHFECETHAKIFTTMMDEETVILGDTEKLRKGLLEIDKKYAPESIIVMGSSVASVIGIDIKGLCHEYQSQIKAKLIPIEGGGLKDDWMKGITAALELLAKNTVSVQQKKVGIQLLGCCADEFNINSETEAVITLLSEVFEQKITHIFPLMSTQDDCRNMANAELNIVLRHEAVPVAEFLEKQFGIPYIYGRPYGKQGTLSWLKQIEKVTGHQGNWTKLTDQINILDAHIHKIKTNANFNKLQYIELSGHPDTVNGLKTFFSKELGLSVRTKSDLYRNKNQFALVRTDDLPSKKVLHKSIIWSGYPREEGTSIIQSGLMGLNGAQYICEKLINCSISCHN
jgi:nitrogenase molybdenum-iron protein alpha/beta subunit